VVICVVERKLIQKILETKCSFATEKFPTFPIPIFLVYYLIFISVKSIFLNKKNSNLKQNCIFFIRYRTMQNFQKRNFRKFGMVQADFIYIFIYISQPDDSYMSTRDSGNWRTRNAPQMPCSLSESPPTVPVYQTRKNSFSIGSGKMSGPSLMRSTSVPVNRDHNNHNNSNSNNLSYSKKENGYIEKILVRVYSVFEYSLK